jgi:hypothetical protein
LRLAAECRFALGGEATQIHFLLAQHSIALDDTLLDFPLACPIVQ